MQVLLLLFCYYKYTCISNKNGDIDSGICLALGYRPQQDSYKPSPNEDFNLLGRKISN